MPVAVTFNPKSLDFGGVLPGASGPDIRPDPSLPPDAISFQGGIEIRSAPADANVTASIIGDTSHFQIRDVSILRFVMRDIDPNELPHGHHGHLPQERVLELVTQGNGFPPSPVKKGDFVLVRVKYAALSSGGTFTSAVVIQGDTWETVQVPLSFFLAQVTTTLTAAPLLIAQGQQADLPIVVHSIAGPETDVRYEMRGTQLHTGISLSPTTVRLSPKDTKLAHLTFQAELHAPLGVNTLFIDQLAFGRTGLLLPVNVTPLPQSFLQKRAEQKINEKYMQIGGKHSPLGLPTEPGVGVKSNGSGFFMDFRGGRITVTDPLGDSPATAKQLSRVEVWWVGLECQVRQEGVDEIYGAIGTLVPGMGLSKTDKFPSGKDFLDMGPDRERIFQPALLLYGGAPTALTIACSLVEHDSGDIERFKTAFTELISRAAGNLGGFDGVAAEDTAANQHFLNGFVIGPIVNFASSLIGADDDPYNPGVLKIAWDELITQRPTMKTLQRSDDPRKVDYNLGPLVVTGTDQGGDTGQYAFYFLVKEFAENRVI